MRLQAGEGLYLHCASLWRESLNLGASQLVDGSVVAGYGSECATRKAVISGADDFSSGWTLSNGVWSRSLPATTPKITQLFIDRQPLRTAQWPDDAAAGPKMALMAAPTGTGTAMNARLNLLATHASQIPPADIVGATVQIRTQAWLIETRRVAGLNGTALVLDNATNWDLAAGQGYVLQDKRWMLDSPGEFFHDTANQRLYLIAPATGAPANLNTATVEGSVRDVVLALTNRESLVVRNLALRGAREDGLRITDAPQAQIERIEASENLLAGVRLWQWVKLPNGKPGPSVIDSLIQGNGQYGIDAQYVSRAQIRRNRVLSTGTAPHHRAGVFAAIYAGPGSSTENNVIDGAGYNGIRFTNVSDNVIARNSISGYCRRLSDCGAIYTWSGRGTPASPPSTSIEDNRISSASAQIEGAVANGSDVVAGIYLDDFTQNVRVRNNELASMPIGIFLHNASDVTVEGNQIWLPTTTGLSVSMDLTDADWSRGNVFRGNHIVPVVQADASTGGLPRFKVSQALWFAHALDGEAALASGRNSFAENKVTQLQGPLAAHALLRGPQGERYVNAVEWQAINPADPLPMRPARFAPVAASLGPELVASGRFATGLAPWGSWENPGGTGFTIQPLSGTLNCAATCMGFVAGHPTDLLASVPFNLRAGAPHVYRWTAAMPATAGATVGIPYVSRQVSPWDAMADSRGFTGYGPRQAAAGEKIEYETFFVAKSSDLSRVNLQVDTRSVQVAFSEVSVREVLGYVTAKVSDWSAVAYAPSDADRVIGCAELGWPAGCSAIGIGGEPLALPFTLPAGTLRPVFRADSSFRR